MKHHTWIPFFEETLFKNSVHLLSQILKNLGNIVQKTKLTH